MSSRTNARAVIWASVFALAWALVEIVGGRAAVPGVQVVWGRYAVHVLFLLAVLGPRDDVRLIRTRRLPVHIFRSMLMLGMPLCFLAAISRMEFAAVMFLFWVSSAVFVLCIALVTGESAFRMKFVAVTTGLVGVWALERPQGDMVRWAAVLPIGMAVCFSLYVEITRRIDDDPETVKLFHTALWVLITLTVVIPVVWKTPEASGVVALVLVGLLGCLGLYGLDTAIMNHCSHPGLNRYAKAYCRRSGLPARD